MRKALGALGILWTALIVVGFAIAGEEKSDLFIGVYVDEVTSQIADDYGVKPGEGVLVTGTVDGSPAQEVGLRANDILLMLGTASLTGPAELRIQIQKYKEGDKVDLKYKRGGKMKTVAITLTERDSEDTFFGEGAPNFEWRGDMGDMKDLEKKIKVFGPGCEITINDEDEDAAFAGIVTQELSDGLKSYFKVERGALISEVVEKSPAEAAGLKAGDIVIKIGTLDIDDTGDVSKAISKQEPGSTVDFLVVREGVQQTITVALTSRKEHYGANTEKTIELGMNGGCLDGRIIYPDGRVETFSENISPEIQELKDLQLELESLPDVQMDLSIDPSTPMLRFNGDQARAISSDSWWKQSWSEVKSKLEVEFQELKANFEQLKLELRQLKEELKQRML
jgi:hypothetical protein